MRVEVITDREKRETQRLHDNGFGDEEDDDDSNDCSEVSDSDFEENSDWTT